MKKITFITTTVVTCCLIACSGNNNTGGMSDKAQKNLASAQAIGKMFESGDFSKLGDYVATDAVDHAGMNGDIKGVDSMKAAYAQMESMSSDMKSETVKELADDDYVFQWLKESSTMKVDAMGMKAGSRNTFDVIEVSKFNADGKAVEHWSFDSWNDVMKMMPQTSMQNNMDSTMKKK